MMRNGFQSQLEQWSDIALTVSLLVAGTVLIGIALLPKHHLEKALVLAWVILP